ncbi:hypothetical protein CN268_14820 [Bacillus anthracis]|nr:hypothetical protein CN488_14745 [Bacillus anthracis]PFB61151.1 hypothetical protein CN268_14820 [Bacillus anthracis]PGR19558.1 hypothetical protein COC50_22125 [Bacillus anthracis]
MSYVVLTRDFNMDLVVNKLVNVSNQSGAIILNKNAILKQRGIGYENVGSMFGNCRNKYGSGLGWNWNSSLL